MGKDLILTFAAGALAGLLFVAPASGSMVVAFAGYLTPLPIYLVCLSLGFSLGVLAAVVGVLVVLVAAPYWLFSVVFAFVMALPALLVCRRALLSRVDASGGTEWYPPGRLAALLAGTLSAAMLIWFAVGLAAGENPRSAIQDLIDATLGAALAPSGGAESPVDVSGLAARLVAVVPGIMASVFLVFHVVTGVLAQRLVRQLGIARRPTPEWSAMTLPSWPAGALLVAGLAGIVVDGLFGYTAVNLAIVLATPFLLQGLAVVHSLAAGLEARRAVLIGFYVLFGLFAGVIGVAAVVILGLVEPYIGLRSRYGAGRKENE